jgi:hypothetical protein
VDSRSPSAGSWRRLTEGRFEIPSTSSAWRPWRLNFTTGTGDSEPVGSRRCGRGHRETAQVAEPRAQIARAARGAGPGSASAHGGAARRERHNRLARATRTVVR